MEARGELGRVVVTVERRVGRADRVDAARVGVGVVARDDVAPRERVDAVRRPAVDVVVPDRRGRGEPADDGVRVVRAQKRRERAAVRAAERDGRAVGRARERRLERREQRDDVLEHLLGREVRAARARRARVAERLRRAVEALLREHEQRAPLRGEVLDHEAVRLPEARDRALVARVEQDRARAAVRQRAAPVPELVAEEVPLRPRARILRVEVVERLVEVQLLVRGLGERRGDPEQNGGPEQKEPHDARSRSFEGPVSEGSRLHGR